MQQFLKRAGRLCADRLLYALGLVILAMLPGLVVAAPVAADGPPPDSACRGCHVGHEGELTFPSNEVLPLGIDLEQLDQSVHGSSAGDPLLCTDCHSPAEYQYPHQPKQAASLEAYARKMADSCARCHPSIQSHNPGHLMATDNPNLPTCTNCHGGGHQIEPVEPLAARPTETCLTCHQSFDDPKIGAVHQEILANLESGQSCKTCHTDRPIFPSDVQCKNCHGLLESSMTLTSGDTVPLHVEANVVQNSVHGEYQIKEHQYSPLLCTDCHVDQARYGFPHQPVTPPTPREFTIEMSNLCQKCHQDIFERQMDSTHAHALEAGNLEAATCVDCHGSHNIQVPNVPRGEISRTCSQCHEAINEEYAHSVHGAALLGEDNPDVPVCIDCHGVHNIEDPTTALFRVRSPLLCARCHANKPLMEKYGISTEVFDTYVADFHGTTVTLFEKQSPDQETNKAVCYDCHGVHDILPPTDENSHVIKANLLATCRQCHPDANANFPDSWTSHFQPSLQHNTLIYLINLFYTIVIPLFIGGFVFFISTDIYRRIVNSWRRS